MAATIVYQWVVLGRSLTVYIFSEDRTEAYLATGMQEKLDVMVQLFREEVQFLCLKDPCDGWLQPNRAGIKC